MDTKKFKMMMLERGLKNYEVAYSLNMTPEKLSGYANNHRRALLEDAQAISAYFGVPLRTLFPKYKELKSKQEKQEASMT